MIERILKLMKKHDVNALTLTSKLGLSNSAITDWRKGKAKPGTDAIIKIAEYFDVTTDYLLTGKNPHETSSKIKKTQGPETIAAEHYGEWTEEELKEIEKFKDFLKTKRI